MRLGLFVKLKYQSNTNILSVGFKYSLHDLLLTSINMPDPRLAIFVTHNLK